MSKHKTIKSFKTNKEQEQKPKKKLSRKGRNISVYVPDEVHDAMKEDAHSDTNWSAIAVAAFRKKLDMPDSSIEGRLAKVERRLAKLSEKINGSDTKPLVRKVG